MNATIREDLLRDAQEEKSFLKSLAELGYDEYKPPVSGIPTELELMVSTYKEQLESLCRLRFDCEIFLTLTKLQPNVEDNRNSLANAEKNVELRRGTILAIRNQILAKLEDNKTDGTKGKDK